MRPHSILLLLFCALFAAADAVKPCDRSLITGVTAEEVKYDSSTKTLTCKDGSNSLMAIDINSILYESLTCDEIDGWKYTYEDATLNSSRIADASAPIHLQCYEYCMVEWQRGVVSHVTNFNGSLSREVTCDHGQQLFVDGQRHLTIRCDIGGWDIKSKIKYYVDPPLKVECKRACTQGNRTNISMSLSSVNESKTMLTCNKAEVNGETYGVSVNGTVYPYLECDSKDGFTYKDTIVADAFATTNLECDILPEPEPPAPAPPVPKTPTNEEQTSDDEDTNKAMVIVGCMAGALIIVIILIVIMCIKRRKDEEEERVREERRHRKREERKKEERRREAESRTETEEVSDEV